jgi:hypothetical protein
VAVEEINQRLSPRHQVYACIVGAFSALWNTATGSFSVSHTQDATRNIERTRANTELFMPVFEFNLQHFFHFF